MNLHLAGRRVVISGGASGIGRACAQAFVAEGAQVALLDLDAARGTALASELAGSVGRAASFFRADISVEADVQTAIAAIVDDLGGIDVVVGCAGISGPFGTDITEIDVDAFDRVMAVNVRGQFLLAKHAAPHLAAAHDPTMVMIASDSSFVAARRMVPYNASKGAVLQLVRALSVDLADRAIRVNCVCPSVVDTPMARADLGDDEFDSARFPIQRPDQVAAHVLYLASVASAPINGASIVSDFGYLARSSFPA